MSALLILTTEKTFVFDPDDSLNFRVLVSRTPFLCTHMLYLGVDR